MSILSFAKKIAGQEQAAKPKKKSAKQAAAKSAPKQEATPTLSANTIELRPLITEKSVTKQAEHNTVAFRVRPDATKQQVAAAVQAHYNVTPLAIRTINQTPKIRRRGRSTGRTTVWKKAYVTFPEGKNIDFTV